MSIVRNKRLMLCGEVIVIRSENRARHKLLVLETRKHRYELQVVPWRIVDGRRCTLVTIAAVPSFRLFLSNC
jgi:hypothetical protein